jgi:ligand-binding sensor domain-containing protein
MAFAPSLQYEHDRVERTIFPLLFTEVRVRIAVVKEKYGASGRRFPLGLFLGLLTLSTCPAGALSLFESLRNAQCDFWQTSDGLPNHDVVSLAQTADGYIWVGMYGSSNSLVRFNGFEFVPAVRLAGNRSRTCLATGKEGRLWICSASGARPLALWQRGRSIPIATTLPTPIDGWIAMCEDRRGNLWMGGKSVLVYTPEGQTQDYRELTNTLGDVRGIAEGKNETMWFATDQAAMSASTQQRKCAAIM